MLNRLAFASSHCRSFAVPSSTTQGKTPCNESRCALSKTATRRAPPFHPFAAETGIAYLGRSRGPTTALRTLAKAAYGRKAAQTASTRPNTRRPQRPANTAAGAQQPHHPLPIVQAARDPASAEFGPFASAPNALNQGAEKPAPPDKLHFDAVLTYQAK